MKENKPIIGIIARPLKTSENNDIYGISEELRKAIIKFGGIPISILPVDDYTYTLDNHEKNKLSIDTENKLISILSLCDGIVFQGGSRWYSYDEFIASYVIKNNIPALGICLGMQLLNYVDTKKDTVLNNSIINHEQKGLLYAHDIKIYKDTLLFDILKKDTILVNSRHQHKIDKINNFKIAATSSDNIIEVIYYPNKKFILGVQFHPESMIEYDINACKIFKYFLKKCIKK